MAQRRMISKRVFETDLFNDLPSSAQTLYTHYILQADDDGFLDNGRLLLRMYGANNDDLKILIAKGFLIPFDDGILAITHWKMMNQIKSDRYHPTIYQKDFKQLELTNEQTYKLLKPNENGNKMDPECIQNGTNVYPNMEPSRIQRVSKMDTQSSLVKSSLVKDSLVKDSKGKVSKGTNVRSNQDKESKYEKIINYLNQKYDLKLHVLDSTKKIIEERFKDHYSLDDFRTVIDNLDKVVNWNNKDQEQKIQVFRPKIIFSKSNFESLIEHKDNTASKPVDPFLNVDSTSNQDETRNFSQDQQISGIIGYINSMYPNDSNKLDKHNPAIRKLVKSEINSYQNDKNFKNHLKEMHKDYRTINDLVNSLNVDGLNDDDLPF